jgi:hypothetical protein
MKKNIIESQIWHQINSSQESSTKDLPDHILVGKMHRKCTLEHCGHFFVAALLAGGVYFMNLWTGDGLWLLAALAATSAFVYIGLAIQSQTGSLVLLNLIAAPFLFASAYAGMIVAPGWLIVSFLLHGSVSAVQLATIERDLRSFMLIWSAFNSAMALFMLLG